MASGNCAMSCFPLQLAAASSVIARSCIESPCSYQIDFQTLLRPTEKFFVVAAFQVLLERRRGMQIHPVPSA